MLKVHGIRPDENTPASFGANANRGSMLRRAILLIPEPLIAWIRRQVPPQARDEFGELNLDFDVVLMRRVTI